MEGLWGETRNRKKTNGLYSGKILSIGNVCMGWLLSFDSQWRGIWNRVLLYFQLEVLKIPIYEDEKLAAAAAYMGVGERGW